MGLHDYLKKRGKLFAADAVGGALLTAGWGVLLFHIPIFTLAATAVGAAGYAAWRAIPHAETDEPNAEASKKATPPEPTEPEPPPPSRAVVAAEARARYEDTLRLLERAGLDDTELQAGRERAKQRYLREIEGLMP